MVEHTEAWHRLHAFLAFPRLSPGCILARLIRTLEPLKVPSYTWPRRDSESEHDFGSTSLMSDNSLSAFKNTRHSRLAVLEARVRTFIDGESRVGEEGSETHVI